MRLPRKNVKNNPLISGNQKTKNKTKRKKQTNKQTNKQTKTKKPDINSKENINFFLLFLSFFSIPAGGSMSEQVAKSFMRTNKRAEKKPYPDHLTEECCVDGCDCEEIVESC